MSRNPFLWRGLYERDGVSPTFLPGKAKAKDFVVKRDASFNVTHWNFGPKNRVGRREGQFWRPFLEFCVAVTHACCHHAGSSVAVG